MTTTSTDQRTDYIAGLRQLVDILDATPDLPLPYAGSAHSHILIFTRSLDELRAWVRAIPGTLAKEVDDDSEAYGFELTGMIGGLHVKVFGDRKQVCTLRVVAVREVTKEVPDPDVLATVPTITVTETVEDVEWDCGPLLAESPQGVTYDESVAAGEDMDARDYNEGAL